ncbi:MAG TPA: 2-oxo acid dehydrogenase subunit E2 [Candidatus Hydrogenedentes bacterium]|nr:2-oxo acid dehydrogenase subunit E2 [Candidatus Hydrogenedentota bacterium]
MLHRICMPAVDATMEEGTIVAWRVREGDTVKAGEILLDLESDKATYEFESPCAGAVRKILVEAGETVPVQQLMAVIGDAADEIPEAWLTARAEETATNRERPAPPDVQPNKRPGGSGGGRIKISPRARKLADELGVDTAGVAGSGPGGRIESADIERAARSAETSGADAPIPFSAVRKGIIRVVTQSKREIPHYYLETTVDMTAAVAGRENAASVGEKVSFNALLMKAAAAGLEAEPGLNVAYSESGYMPRASVDIGLAVETPEGVVIPVIENVVDLDLAELSARIDACVAAARGGRFPELKMCGAAVSVSNLGMYRVETFMPIIRPGECAILGVGRIADRPVVENGAVVVRKTARIAMSVDHRVADGAIAARFLEAFAAYIEHIR